MKTSREKIAHLYRRLGFGATPAELDEAEKLGLDKSIERLVDFHKLPETGVRPEEYVWREKEEADVGSYRFRMWWVFQMVATQRPLEEKLALFWHDHFAVSDNKVEFGPMMLDYLQSLRSNGAGKFRILLDAMSKEPAMMRYLDMDRAIKGKPNENFAREVMELFTLGIGNYTEEDVQNAARALTGWGFINTFWELPGDSTAKMKESIKYQRPFCSFTYLPQFRDSTPKTILGKTADFDGNQLIALLAKHPKTADNLCRKLWEFFAYPNPEPEVVRRLAGVYQRTDGDIREVVRSIAKSKEFYSEKAHLALVKCPVDYVIPLARKSGFGVALAQSHKAPATPENPIAKPMLDQPGGLAYFMDRQGMSLFYPPNVSGWEWGPGWISAQNMLERINFYGVIVWGEDGKWIKPMWEYVKAAKPADSRAAAKATCDFLDANLPDAAVDLVAKRMDASGKADFVQNWDQFRGTMHQSLKVLFGAPEFHMM